MGAAISGARACGVGVASALFLSACASSGGGSAVFGNLLAFNSVNAPQQVAHKIPVKVECPAVTVADQGSSVRVYSGADHSNDDVRYQYDLGQLARQCAVENGQIAIKVGVSGRVLLGPAGSPGAFTVPILIAVRRESDRKIVASKVYRTSVVVPAGGGQALFTTVSQPLLVPYTREEADQDYTIRVGFDQGGKAESSRPRRRRRR